MATVYEYELELVVKSKIDGKTSTKWTKEFAYSPQDAVAQASFSNYNDDEEVIKIARIGPPRELIAAVEKETRNMIASVMKRLSIDK